MLSASAWASSRMISSTPRHCWKSGSWAGHIRATRPLVCWARRVAKRSATLCSAVLSTTTRNLRGARDAGLLMAASLLQLALQVIEQFQRLFGRQGVGLYRLERVFHRAGLGRRRGGAEQRQVIDPGQRLVAFAAFFQGAQHGPRTRP